MDFSSASVQYDHRAILKVYVDETGRPRVHLTRFKPGTSLADVHPNGLARSSASGAMADISSATLTAAADALRDWPLTQVQAMPGLGDAVPAVVKMVRAGTDLPEWLSPAVDNDEYLFLSGLLIWMDEAFSSPGLQPDWVELDISPATGEAKLSFVSLEGVRQLQRDQEPASPPNPAFADPYFAYPDPRFAGFGLQQEQQEQQHQQEEQQYQQQQQQYGNDGNLSVAYPDLQQYNYPLYAHEPHPLYPELQQQYGNDNNNYLDGQDLTEGAVWGPPADYNHYNHNNQWVPPAGSFAEPPGQIGIMPGPADAFPPHEGRNDWAAARPRFPKVPGRGAFGRSGGGIPKDGRHPKRRDRRQQQYSARGSAPNAHWKKPRPFGNRALNLDRAVADEEQMHAPSKKPMPFGNGAPSFDRAGADEEQMHAHSKKPRPFGNRAPNFDRAATDEEQMERKQPQKRVLPPAADMDTAKGQITVVNTREGGPQVLRIIL